MSVACAIAFVAALAVGFLGGFTTFKIKLRWCPQCGVSLACVECTASRRVRPAGTRS